MKLAIAGCSGRMGQALIKSALAHANIELVGGSVSDSSQSLNKDLGAWVGSKLGVKASADLGKAFANADVIIDFTLPDIAIASLDYYASHQKKVVFGGTGFSKEQQQAIVDAAKLVPIVQGSNMSIGANLCFKLAAKAAKVLKDYDVEIFDAHHKNKVDAPSGTAISFGEHIAKARGLELDKVAQFDRHGKHAAREHGEIGFSSVRAGDIFGDHTIYFANAAERVEITHRASSRDAFSQGALLAALWLHDQSKPGLYGMDDVLGLS